MTAEIIAKYVMIFPKTINNHLVTKVKSIILCKFQYYIMHNNYIMYLNTKREQHCTNYIQLVYYFLEITLLYLQVVLYKFL